MRCRRQSIRNGILAAIVAAIAVFGGAQHSARGGDLEDYATLARISDLRAVAEINHVRVRAAVLLCYRAQQEEPAARRELTASALEGIRAYGDQYRSAIARIRESDGTTDGVANARKAATKLAPLVDGLLMLAQSAAEATCAEAPDAASKVDLYNAKSGDLELFLGGFGDLIQDARITILTAKKE